MAHARNSTTSSVQVQDMYLDLAPLLSTEGWVKTGDDIVDTTTNITWYVWQNPSSNSGLDKDFYVAIGFATSGTGSMYFRMFEDYLGPVSPVQPDPGNPIYQDPEYHCQRPVPVNSFTWNGTFATNPDNGRFSVPNTGTGSGGKQLFVNRTGGSHTPFPLTQGPLNGNINFRQYDRKTLDGDYSVAIWGNSNTFDATATEQSIVANAPHTFDFRSAYLREHEILADDTTALEYVIHVNPKSFTIGTALVFSDVYDVMYVGSYQPITAFDPMPICIHPMVQSVVSFTRDNSYDENLPQTVVASVAPTTSFFRSIYISAWTPTPDSINQTITSPNDLDLYAKGPLASRISMEGLVSGNYRGLMYGPLLTYHAATSGTPPIELGDEATINGNPYYFVGNLAVNGGTIIKPSIVDNNGRVNYRGLWIPKS